MNALLAGVVAGAVAGAAAGAVAGDVASTRFAQQTCACCVLVW
jgi:hypothetical protein